MDHYFQASIVLSKRGPSFQIVDRPFQAWTMHWIQEMYVGHVSCLYIYIFFPSFVFVCFFNLSTVFICPVFYSAITKPVQYQIFSHVSNYHSYSSTSSSWNWTTMSDVDVSETKEWTRTVIERYLIELDEVNKNMLTLKHLELWSLSY